MMIVDFVVWAERPTGRVDEGTARWLADALAGGGAALITTARRIAREIVEEAQSFENDALVAFAGVGASGAKSRNRAPEAVLMPAA